MDKKLERNIIWTLAIILIALGLFGCAKPKIDADKKEPTALDTIGNMDVIVDVISCTFKPSSPNCDKSLKDKPISAITGTGGIDEELEN